MFPSFQAGHDLVKMKNPSKKNTLIGSWEGLYLFVGYVNEQGVWNKMMAKENVSSRVRMNNNGSVLK